MQVSRGYTQKALWRPRTGVLPRNPRGFSDVAVDRPKWKRVFGKWRRPESTKGYGLDLNGNGRFDRGRDGVLVFDFNKNGKYDKGDVAATNNMMKAASGNFDFNGDGKVSWKEKLMGKVYQKKHKKLDRNGDGRLDRSEIARGGGKVWVDRNRDGNIGRSETHSVYRVPGGLRGLPKHPGGPWNRPLPRPLPGGPWDRPMPRPLPGGPWNRPMPRPLPGGPWDRPMPRPLPGGPWDNGWMPMTPQPRTSDMLFRYQRAPQLAAY